MMGACGRKDSKGIREDLERVNALFPVLKEIHEQGIAILLIEQNANKALALADRGYVIESGTIVLEDSAANLLGNDQVRRAYLGES